ncbi:MAG: hypothetical protein RL425_1213, partial [Pseudomonadota bacterium]
SPNPSRLREGSKAKAAHPLRFDVNVKLPLETF